MEESPVTIHFDLLRIKLSTNVINNTSEPFQMQSTLIFLPNMNVKI